MNVAHTFSRMQNVSMRGCECLLKGSTSSLRRQIIRLNERCVYICFLFLGTNRHSGHPTKPVNNIHATRWHEDKKGKASFLGFSWVSNVVVVYPYLDTRQREPRRGTWASKDKMLEQMLPSLHMTSNKPTLSRMSDFLRGRNLRYAGTFDSSFLSSIFYWLDICLRFCISTANIWWQNNLN